MRSQITAAARYQNLHLITQPPCREFRLTPFGNRLDLKMPPSCYSKRLDLKMPPPLRGGVSRLPLPRTRLDLKMPPPLRVESHALLLLDTPGYVTLRGTAE